MRNHRHPRFFLLIFCLATQAAKSSAQEPPPPMLNLSQGPPPGASSLAQPALAWEPLGPFLGAGPEPVPLEPLYVPAPEPQPTRQPDPPIEPPGPDDPNAPAIDKGGSEAEVWRPESEYPQIPPKIGSQFRETYVAGSDPVMVRLQFDPLAAGKMVIVRRGPGVTVIPPDPEFYVEETGECIVSVKLDPSISNSHIEVVCDGRRQIMPVSRAPLPVVVAKEEETGGAQ